MVGERSRRSALRGAVASLELVARRRGRIVGRGRVGGRERTFVRGGAEWWGLPGGAPLVVGRAVRGGFAISVPHGARGASMPPSGIGRVVFGPAELELGAGDRAVLTLGDVTVRARVVPPAPRFRVGRRVRRSVAWALVVAVLLAVGIAASSRPRAPVRIPPQGEVKAQ